MAWSIPSGSELINRSKETLSRFPLAMIASLVVTVILVYLTETEMHRTEGVYFVLARVALSASLGVFVFTAMHLWMEQLSKTWHGLWMLLGVVGIVAYYFWLPERLEDFGATMVPFRHFFLSLLFLVAFLWAPFVRTSPENSDYWEYAKQMMFALVMAFLFTIIAILGVNGAIFAIEKLFDVDMASKRYFEVDIIIIGVFSVGYFLSQIPADPLASRFVAEPPRVERFFTKWLLTSLSGLYFVILYAYTAKVLFTMDWPKGILAWLIVIFSAVAVLTYLFWTHFAQAEHGGWRRWIWLAVLVQTVMLFVAIGMRIGAYSWTESRYMVFVLGVWLAGVSLYFLLWKRAQLKWIFLSLSLLIAITQFGPLSAYSVSKAAQMQRLQTNVLKLQKHPIATKAPVKLRYEISDGIQYLHRRYKGDALSRVFPEKVRAFEALKAQRDETRKKRKSGIAVPAASPSGRPEYLPEYLTEELGFAFVNKWEYRRAEKGEKSFAEFRIQEGFAFNAQTLLDVKGYDRIARIDRAGYEMVDAEDSLKPSRGLFEGSNVTFVYRPDFTLEITAGGETVVFDLAQTYSALARTHASDRKRLPKEEMTLQAQQGKTKVRLRLDTLGKRTVRKHEVVYFSGILFLKEMR